jgi:hypothetical protein
MPVNSNIRTVVVTVHLGGLPSFDIRADESATASTMDLRLTGQGTGPADRALLVEVLDQIRQAFGSSPALTLCVNGRTIHDASRCA